MGKAFVSLLVMFVLAIPVFPQQPQPQKPKPETEEDQDSVVRITSNLVQVDAVVTKDGRVVSHLTPNDFVITEDGKPQTITHFSYVSNVPNQNSENAAARSTPSTASAVLPAVVRRDDPRRTIAFVVDDLGISLESIRSVKEQLTKFVDERLQPQDLVAIIRTGGEVGALQQFTNDRRLLHRAIDSLRWNLCSRVGYSAEPALANMVVPTDTLGSGQNAVGLCAELQGGPLKGTVRALRFILAGMGNLPGRKAMVLLSDSLPLDLPNVNSLERGPIKAQIPIHDDPDADSVRNEGETQFDNETVLRKVAELANRSSVVIYSVDTRGTKNIGLTAADNQTPSGPGRKAAGTEMLNRTALRALNDRSASLQDLRGGMSLLAKQTGGLMISNSNDLQLDRVVEDQSGYYVLGYRPSNETFNRSFHRIKVRLTSSGLTLRTREGFYGLSDKEVAQGNGTTREQMTAALISPFGANQIEVHMTSLFANDKSAGSFIRSMVYLNPGDLKFATEGDGRRSAKLHLWSILFDVDGRVVQQVEEDRTLKLTAKDFERAAHDGLVYQLDVPAKQPGAYQLRVAVRDTGSAKLGSAAQLVEIPALAVNKIALSGITLSTENETAAPKSDSSQGAETGVATNVANLAMRRFRSSSNLYYSYVVYVSAVKKSAEAPSLSAEAKLFREGTLVYGGAPKSIDPAGQTDLERIAAAGGLRLNSLSPGAYVLQVTVKDQAGKRSDATQLIDFEVIP
ncbi:MAG TPA: VWA domain-containing protein [Pyrinomonadaceae bacterium]|jgi:VWFA-related protein|nr:VWA domain-containing protein [Pyrinomonadaceae bacterium]